MLYRALDANGDYSFGRGMQDFLSKSQAVGQAVKTRLLLLKEEWWEDTSDGLPLFQQILAQAGTRKNLDAVDLVIKDRIRGTPGVSRIITFNSTYAQRQYAVMCEILTIYGDIVPVEVEF